MNRYLEIILNGLSKFNPSVAIATTGSVYISFEDSRVRQIRIANHKGHKSKRNTWELRTDAMTSRGKNNNRIYNVNAINSLIADFK